MAERLTMSDEQILQMYYDGSESAIRETQAKYGRYLLAIANGILGNAADAEECVNDLYLRTWSGIPQAKPQNLKAYLTEAMRNIAISRLRKNQAAKRGGEALIASYEELSESIPDNRRSETADSEKLRETMNGFLGMLSRDKRSLFLKRYWLSRSVAEIAREIGKDERYVSNQLYNLRKKLKKYLEKNR